MPTSKNNSKSMDIQKPGSVKPDSSSKPIIVTNRPILQDPMVKDTSANPDTPEATEAVEEKPKEQTKSMGSTKVIQPLNSDEDKATPESTTDTPSETSDTSPASDQTKSEETPEPKTIDSLPEDADEPVSSEKAVVDAVVAGANKSGETNEAQAEMDADAKRHQAAQVLAESKKYVVPIGQVAQARHNRNALVLLVLLLVVAAGFFAVYKGFIPLPFKLPLPIPN